MNKNTNAAIGFFICIKNHNKARNRDLGFKSARNFLPVFGQFLIIQTIIVGVHRTNGIRRYLNWKISLTINILKSHYKKYKIKKKPVKNQR